MTLAAPAPHTAEDRVVPFPAPAPGPASDASRVSSDVPLNVWSEQIRLLRQHPSLILFNLVNALLVVIVLWRVFPRELLLGWYTLFVIVIPVRLILIRLSRLRGWTSGTVAGFAVAGSAATGVIWGFLAWPILVIPGLVYRSPPSSCPSWRRRPLPSLCAAMRSRSRWGLCSRPSRWFRPWWDGGPIAGSWIR